MVGGIVVLIVLGVVVWILHDLLTVDRYDDDDYR